MKAIYRNIRKTLIYTLVALLLAQLAVGFNAKAVEAKSSTRIGHATNDERGRLTGGKAGDQKGNEVCMGNWRYGGGAFGWTFVARAKDARIAANIAKYAKDGCNNNKIGYDKNNRLSFFNAAKKNGWDIAGITTGCECDCISFISTVCNAAGTPVSRYAGSKTLNRYIKDTNDFVIYTSSDYTKSSSRLQPGDILCAEGRHGCIVVESPNAIEGAKKSGNLLGSVGAKIFTPFKAGKDYVLKTDLRVRKGPGTSYTSIKYRNLSKSAKPFAYSDCSEAIFKKGTVVTCIKTKGNWIKVPSGWICGKENGEKYIKLYKGESSTSTVSSTSSSSLNKAKTSKKATSKKATSKYIVGKDYKLARALYIRKGPGTNYAIKKRLELSTGAKAFSLKMMKAMLKSGTEVTCLEVNGDWMRIPSGWICCKVGNIK